MPKSSSKMPDPTARRRWRPQFSLRTLLILVTLVAIVLGVWVRPAEERRQAIQTLRRAGAVIYYRPKDPCSRDSGIRFAFGKILRAEYLNALGLNHQWPGTVPQAEIDRRESELRQLERAIAEESRPSWLPRWLLPDEWFQRVLAVDLVGCQLKDELAALAKLRDLEDVNLDRSSVTDAEVPDLARLKGLRTLGLRGTEVSDEGVQELRKALPTCLIWQ